MGIRVGRRAGRAGREPWLAPPRLRTSEEGDDRRHATWLELFFDLVFLVPITELILALLAAQLLIPPVAVAGGLAGVLAVVVFIERTMIPSSPSRSGGPSRPVPSSEGDAR